MPFSITGYVLEPPRVGQANSPFTFTPNNFISNQAAFNTAFPSNESAPPAEYLVQVMTDGDLPDAVFGWTKNEVIARFDYAGQDQRFKTLPGKGLEVLGQLGPTSNTTRLKAFLPISTNLVSYPVRVSVGSVGSGVTFAATVVVSFGLPVVGAVEILGTTGELNWNPADLVTYNGQDVRFQRQTFFSYSDSNGKLGLIDDVLFLNPLPATTQYPLLRIAFGPYLTPVEVANDAGLLPLPASGSVKWSAETGRLAFNAIDVSGNTGQAIYYDGVLTQGSALVTIPVVTLTGSVSAPGPLFPGGNAASITAVALGVVTITGLSGMTAGMVGQKINISGASTLENNGRFTITAFLSATSVQYANNYGVAPDANNPNVSWVVAPPEQSDIFFRIPGVVQFPGTKWVDATTSGKRGTVEILRKDGSIKFSDADIVAFGADVPQAIVPNLLIERGISLELFRTPIDPGATDPTTKDVSALYATTKATLADPIIASPTVLLPATPVDSPQIVVSVIDKTGTSAVLPRLDVPVPPDGIGCVIDSESRALLYAERRSDVVISTPLAYGAVTLPDPLVFKQNLKIEIETAPNSGVYVPLTLGQDYLIDTGSGTVSVVETDGTFVAAGSGGTLAGTTFTDPGQNFTSGTAPLPVLVGDQLLITKGTSVGVYTVANVVNGTTLTTDIPGLAGTNLTYEIRRGEEILADRFFKPISPLDPNTKVERLLALGTTTNSPRYTIPLTDASSAKSRFRFGSSTFSTVVTTVPDDPSFTIPSSLPAGTVEISLTTGHLNFSSADVTAALTVYWVRTLTLGTDYTIQPPLGFIQFNDRFIAEEEAIITYKSTNAPDTIIVEQATFLVRKETTAAHPAPTSVLFFNPLGRPVATNPPPRVFRGGRPQVNGVQVIVDTVASTITFLSDGTLTNALPHGPIVGPTENVYIDYYVTKAIGGESNITVLQPPMATAIVQTYGGAPLALLGNGIVSGGTQFTIPGDRTADFLPESLLRINGDRQELYLIGSSSFDVVANATTVILAGTQEFQSDNSVPSLFVTSGATRLVASFPQPSYFLTEVATYQILPRGSNKVRLFGDLSGTYTLGKVMLFTDGVFTDFYQVNGSTFSETSGFTEVQITANTQRQYTSATLKRSVRSILESSTKTAQTSKAPVLALPYTVYRRIEGQVGIILSQPDDYQINDSGAVTFVKSLQDKESWDILYTGHTIVEAGRRIRASYTFQIIPSEANGLLGNTLVADYTTYAPDTFFYRVQTFTNFRGELADEWQKDAQASIPSGGPILSNMSQPKLFEQGRESLFFQEGHLANEDIVARATLKFYNDAVNYLEDALQDMDGRVVGDRDGRFVFDGLIDNPPRTTFASVTNQIDDRYKVSPAPYSVSFPPFVVASIGTYQAVYLPDKSSRFFPTQRARYNVTAGGTTDGDPILDTKSKSLTAVSGVQRRSPWAVLVLPADIGDTVLSVDFSEGDSDLLRPGFVGTEKVQIATPSTSYATGLTVSATNAVPTPQTVTLTAPLVVAIPVGATLFLDPSDTVYRKVYRVGFDVGVDLAGGQLTYITPGSIDITPANVSPAAGEVLDLTAQLTPLDVAPDRFPALDGFTTDDDGDRQLPALNPSIDSEAPDLNGTTIGHLGTELSIIRTAGPVGTLRDATTPPYMDTGDVDALGTTITATLVFPATVKVYDLVRILTGTNALSSFHRILTVVGNVITVTPAFIGPDTGFTFTVTASASLVTSVAGGTSTTTTLNDAAGNFIVNGVLPGHTVVLTTGPSTGQRRQVLTVVSATSLTVSPAFGTTMAGQTYRIDDALGTFGGTGSIQAQLASELTGELGVLDTNTPPGPYAERQAIEQFYDTVFTDIFTSATGSTATTTTLTDLSANFTLDMEGDYVYIRFGADGGVYKIQTVNSSTSLDVEAPGFPATLAGVSYRIVESTGSTKQTLQALYPILVDVDDFIDTTTTWYTLVTTPVTVAPDASAFARGWLTADLDAREALVSTRVTDLNVTLSPTGSTGTIQSVLSAGDRLYDQRYTWIDARINRQTGIIVKQAIAVQNRLKAEADIVNQLTKLLTAP